MEFHYKDYVIIYSLDGKCLTCLVDVLIVGSMLMCYSSFVVSHKLYEAKKNQIFNSSEAPSTPLAKLAAYLWLSITGNFLLVCVLLCIFRHTNPVLLFILTYKVW